MHDPLTKELRRAWQKGWQPRDLMWLVETNLSRDAASCLGAAILDDAAAYDGVQLDGRWQAQIDVVLNEHKVATVSAAAELISLYVLALPSVPKLIPPPGETVGLSVAASGSLDPKILGRVRALLAKAESTDFPDEAESLSAKAQELMARHAIDRVLLAAGAQEGEPEGRRLHIDSPYAAPKSMLLCEVAEANRCRVVWSRHLQIATVFGFPADLDATELLFTSLLIQATSAILGARPEFGEGIKSFRRSFLMAYGARIGERLTEISRAAVDSSDQGSLLPALASRADAVDEATAAMFPTLGHYRVSHSSPSGMAAGRRAAERADLNGPRVSRATRSIGRT
jgi:hypothetical protein